MSKLSYRPEIDGLRAIAMLSVVIYHAELLFRGRDWVQGGYVGVDMFFVISGYLITRIILTELYSTGSFSFLKFYERRARRILPVLLLVMLVSFPLAWYTLLSTELVEYGWSIISAIFFSSNFFFYFNVTEYGADSALLKPFIHTWSLGVEEQFYLIFPVYAILAYKFFKQYWLHALIVISIASLVYAEYMSLMNPDLSFYLPFSRIWELAAGSFLAYRELNKKERSSSISSNFFSRFSSNFSNNFSRNESLTKVLPWIGLLMLAYSIVSFDYLTAHPGFATLIPIIGVSLIIVYSSQQDRLGKLLGSKPFVWFGLISYSAYLWHFPIFAFARNMSLNHSQIDKLGWILLTFVLAFLSYHLVEQPFRNQNRVSKKPFYTFLSLAVLISVFTSFGFIKGYIASDDKQLVTTLLDNGKYKAESVAFELERDYQVKKDERPSILVVGNSHAEDLYKVLSFSELNNSYRLNLSSPKLRSEELNYQVRCLYDFLSEGTTRCKQSKKTATFEYGPNINAQYQDADIVVLASAWYEPDLEMLPKLINKLIADNKQIVVVSNTPQSEVFGEKKLNRLDRFLFENKRVPNDAELIELEQEFYSDYVQALGQINDSLKNIVEQASSPLVTYADRAEYMCEGEAKRCSLYFVDVQTKVLYDYGHVTTAGARELAKRINAKQWLSKQLIR